MNGNELWLDTLAQQPRAKDMILVNAFFYGLFPHPTTPEFVPIPTLIEKNITTLKPQFSALEQFAAIAAELKR